MEIKSIYELISLISTIASLILAVGAIWLSIVFYKLSNDASKATTEAAKGIAASVERLEKLFDKLYSDTFSMMRDTVTDMRKHIWPEDENVEQESALAEAESKADRKVDELKQVIETQLQSMLARQKLAEEKNQTLQLEIRQLIDRAILTSRKVEIEAREETLKEHVLRTIRRIRKFQERVDVEEILSKLGETFPPRRIITEVRKLRDEGLVELSTDDIRPHTEVKLIPDRFRVVGSRFNPDSKT